MKNTTDTSLNRFPGIDDLEDGSPWYILGEDGTRYPAVRGGATGDDDDDTDDDQDDTDGDDQDDDQDDDDDQDGDDADGDDDDDEVFTQEDVNKIASREKKEGRTAERKRIFKELGVSNIDEAKRKVAGSTKAKPKGKGKDADEDTDDTSEQDTQAEREQNRKLGKVERALLRAGIADDDPKALKGALAMIDIDDLIDDDDITTAVDELKEERPGLFEEADGTTARKKKTVVRSDAGRGKRRRKTAPPADAAKELLEKRHGKISST